METTRLGKTRLSYARDQIGGVPIICLPLDEAVKATQRSLDLKVKSIDTSVGDEDNEQRFGNPIVGRREHVTTTTKTWVVEKPTAPRR
ncbi:MAG: hypothetical protein ACETV1_05990 [Candidatus Bathyarchaeia archaeon]|jgi:diketogulonate reductase-like aldo/keto reductase